MGLTEQKQKHMEQLSDKNGIISALAFDQRGALKRLMAKYQSEEPTVSQIEALKVLVAEELTPYASSMLLDPEYGLPATKVLDDNAGLLLAYEKTGYDTSSTKRLPDCLDIWSAKRIKEEGADAVKFLLYYDVDSSDEVNEEKEAYIERIGSECVAEDIPFFLEILSYDEKITDSSGIEYAKIKPRKVIEAMKVFSNPRFNIDVLKVEVPVNMDYVEGFAQGETAYNKATAAAYFREQDQATLLPYIFLSAGVPAQLFQETLVFAKEAGAKFNGVLCGRATWAGSVKEYVEKGEAGARQWLRTIGFQNIDELNKILQKTMTSITDSQGVEYLWQGDATYWGGQAPILFPICGSVRNDCVIYRPAQAPHFTGIIPRHGFVRHKTFDYDYISDSSVRFTIKSSKEMLINYPYRFSLEITYTLRNKSIAITYIVKNLESEKNMPYAIGAHPGFNCPLFEKEVFSDYYLEFEQFETCTIPESFPDTGLLDLQARHPFLENQKQLSLNHALFEKDAITLDQLRSKTVYLKSRNHAKGIQLDFDDFENLILWTSNNGGPFLALEPWSSLSTSIEESDILEDKQNIVRLNPKQSKQHSIRITIL